MIDKIIMSIFDYNLEDDRSTFTVDDFMSIYEIEPEDAQYLFSLFHGRSDDLELYRIVWRGCRIANQAGIPPSDVRDRWALKITNECPVTYRDASDETILTDIQNTVKDLSI